VARDLHDGEFRGLDRRHVHLADEPALVGVVLRRRKRPDLEFS
jgi:hypothetical protein